MASLALPLYLLFVAVAFAWRSWLQWRRTGDPGIRGISLQSTRAERVARVLLGISFAFLGATSYAAWLRPPMLALPAPVQGLGVLAALGGLALTVLAQLQMGASWRMGLDRSESTSLVRRGLFAHVRNPIYTAMLLATLGLVLLAPGALALLAWLLLWIGLELQVRAVEEPHLTRVHGDPYRSYLREVGRFFPGVGRGD
jgi:protein-S-isoprenylcysteine O-methyltransferase Ste14